VAAAFLVQNVGLFTGVGAGFGNAVAGGFAGGVVGTGTLEGGVHGAFGAALFFGAGSFADIAGGGAQFGPWAQGGAGRAGAHAVAGCISASVSGGGCGPGALSAGFAELANPFPKTDPGAELVARAVIGGTASMIGGGSFANGAITASFAYLFNQMAHQGRDPLDRHNREVDRLIQEDIAKGYTLVGTNVRVTMDGQTRVYDYVVYDPVTEVNLAKEVKTTLASTVFLNPRQVEFDVSLTMRGGTASQTGIFIQGVGYEAVCFMCSSLDVRGTVRANALEAAGVPIIRTNRPGIYERR
jgi:hypothetical protein